MSYIHIHVDSENFTHGLLVSGELTALYRSYEGAEEAAQIFDAMHPGEFDVYVIDVISGEILWKN